MFGGEGALCNESGGWRGEETPPEHGSLLAPKVRIMERLVFRESVETQHKLAWLHSDMTPTQGRPGQRGQVIRARICDSATIKQWRSGPGSKVSLVPSG